MAVYYGGTSKYVNWLGRKFLLWFIVGVAFVLAFAIRLSQIADSAQSLVLLILFLSIGGFLYGATKYNIRSKKISFGKIGEWQIKEELLKLPNEYFVFQDVVIGKGNIDFAVVGPSGIYAIEAKSHAGRIESNGFTLTRNGRPFEKDFIRQTKHEAMDLKQYLEGNLNQQIYVKGLLVFSRKDYLNFGLNEISGVFVLGRLFLVKFIHSKTILDQVLINRIKDCLVRIDPV